MLIVKNKINIWNYDEEENVFKKIFQNPSRAFKMA